MKRLLTAAALASTLLVSVQVLHADDHFEDRGNPEKRYIHLVERLNLTEEQQNQILPLLKSEAEKHRALREETKQQISSFLTEEQKQQLQERKRFKKDCDGKGRDGHKDRDDD
jgi:Spy/CpxP family protein refolding chaperone